MESVKAMFPYTGLQFRQSRLKETNQIVAPVCVPVITGHLKIITIIMKIVSILRNNRFNIASTFIFLSALLLQSF